MGYDVGFDMRLNVLPEIAANWWPCITWTEPLDMRPFMRLEKKLEERDWVGKRGRILCQRVRLLLGSR